MTNRRTRIRPAPGGVSIGHKDITAGTLGVVVFKEENVPDPEPPHNPGPKEEWVECEGHGFLKWLISFFAPGCKLMKKVQVNPELIKIKKLILSNNHVLANSALIGEASRKGEDIIQPGRYDGGNPTTDVIAKLEDYEPLDPTSSFIDAAIASPINEDDVVADILDIGRVAGVNTDPVVNMPVRKSGRTTDLTTGTLVARNVNLYVNFGVKGNILFRNQLLFSYMSQGGDSGSLIVDDQNKAVALLFAGSNTTTIGCPIQPVLDRFGVKL